MVFFDSDIGLETGKASYMQAHGLEKYLMHADLSPGRGRSDRRRRYSRVPTFAEELLGTCCRRWAMASRVDDGSRHVELVRSAMDRDLAFLVAVRDRKLGGRVAKR